MNLIKILQPQRLFRLVVVLPLLPHSLALTNASGNGESALLIRFGTLKRNQGRTGI